MPEVGAPVRFSAYHCIRGIDDKQHIHLCGVTHTFRCAAHASKRIDTSMTQFFCFLRVIDALSAWGKLMAGTGTMRVHCRKRVRKPTAPAIADGVGWWMHIPMPNFADCANQQTRRTTKGKGNRLPFYCLQCTGHSFGRMPWRCT